VEKALKKLEALFALNVIGVAPVRAFPKESLLIRKKLPVEVAHKV
jgi:hypothetical protein